MTRFVGIDLAERMSAAVVIDHGGTVLYETCLDAGQQENPPNPFKNIDAVRDWLPKIEDWTSGPDSDDKWVVEVPHFHARNGEPALLVHGAMLSTMRDYGVKPENVLRIRSMEWQNFFGYSKNEHGNTKVWAAEYADTYLKYAPGCTWEPGTRMVKKMKEDLIDARVLAEYLRLTS